MNDLRKRLRLFAFLIKSFIKNPPEVIFRFVQYFFYILINKKMIIEKVPMLNNLKMVLDLNSHFDRSIFFSGILGKHVESNIFNFLSKNLKKNSVFFEVGPNSGYFSLLASLIVKKGFIHAFEPVPRTYENFKKSIKLNKIKNIKLNKVCVGNKNGTVKFYVSFYSDVSGLKKTPYQKGNKMIKSKMITLDNYCGKNKINKLNIIKIDTEGAEKNIIFASGKTIKKFHPKMIIEFCNKTAKPFDYHPNEVYDFLTNLGYKAYNWDGEDLRIQPKKNYYEDEDLYFIYKN